MPTALQTEYEFTLPLGYLDGDGDLHREGVMRLATAADEILPLRDPRVQANPAYLVVLLLSRVVVRLGRLERITPQVIEGLFAADLGHLQELYNRANALAEDTRPTRCPQCDHVFAPSQPPGQQPAGGPAAPTPFAAAGSRSIPGSS
ncbi:MAG: phage tail assembly protein [Frankiaceae bacterium]